MGWTAQVRPKLPEPALCGLSRRPLVQHGSPQRRKLCDLLPPENIPDDHLHRFVLLGDLGQQNVMRGRNISIDGPGDGGANGSNVDRAVPGSEVLRSWPLGACEQKSSRRIGGNPDRTREHEGPLVVSEAGHHIVAPDDQIEGIVNDRAIKIDVLRIDPEQAGGKRTKPLVRQIGRQFIAHTLSPKARETERG